MTSTVPSSSEIYQSADNNYGMSSMLYYSGAICSLFCLQHNIYILKEKKKKEKKGLQIKKTKVHLTR